MGRIEKFIEWFLEDFKPQLMYISTYIGLLAITGFISLILCIYIKIYEGSGNFLFFWVLSSFGFFSFDDWMRNIIINKKIDEFVKDELMYIDVLVDEDNNSAVKESLNEIIVRVKEELKNNNVYSEKYIGGLGDKKREIDEKVKHRVYGRYEYIKKLVKKDN